MKDSESKLRSDMTANAMAYNNCLTKTYLNSKPIQEVFCFTHPSERLIFSKRLKERHGIIVDTPDNQDA